jgi:hypothetical protein
MMISRRWSFYFRLTRVVRYFSLSSTFCLLIYYLKISNFFTLNQNLHINLYDSKDDKSLEQIHYKNIISGQYITSNNNKLNHCSIVFNRNKLSEYRIIAQNKEYNITKEYIKIYNYGENNVECKQLNIVWDWENKTFNNENNNNSPKFVIVQSGDSLDYLLRYLWYTYSILDYCSLHDYKLIWQITSSTELNFRPPAFGKLLSIYSISKIYSNAKILFMDSDSFINVDQFKNFALPKFLQSTPFTLHADLIFQGEHAFCSGVIIANPSSFTFHILEKVWSQGLFEYTKTHTWEQKALTHILNTELSGYNKFYYHSSCLESDCEPLLRKRVDECSQLWKNNWGPIAFIPLNLNSSLIEPQLHSCKWRNCENLPGLIIHVGNEEMTIGPYQ